MLRQIADDVNKQRTFYGSSGGSLSSSQHSLSRQPRKSSAKSTARSSTSSFRSPFSCASSTSYSTPRSSGSHGSLLYDPPQTIPEDAHAHKHWCTYKKHLNIYGTCDGWKRHMKEHETVFQCMLLGPRVDVGGIEKCAFCGIQDPSDTHLQEYHGFECTGTSNMPLTKSRKSNMVLHLEAHNMTGHAASVLADKWRCTIPKKSFSCGFCVRHFSTLGEQLNHIDNEHFARGQGMSEWSWNNVIRGLLLQPHVNDAWQLLLGSLPGLVASELFWDLLDAETLQFKLQMGEQSGQDLASAALSASNYDMIDCCWDEAKPMPISKENTVRYETSTTHGPSAASTMQISSSNLGWDQDHRLQQRGVTTWNCKSTLPDWSDRDLFLPPPIPSQIRFPQAGPTFPNTSSSSDYIPDSLSTKSLSSTGGWNEIVHIPSAIYNVPEPYLPSQTCLDIGLDTHTQLSSPTAGASPMDHLASSSRRHPAGTASVEASANQVPPRSITFDEMAVSISPAACKASVMLRGHPDSPYSRQEKPLPAVPAPNLELGPTSPMDLDFSWI